MDEEEIEDDEYEDEEYEDDDDDDDEDEDEESDDDEAAAAAVPRPGLRGMLNRATPGLRIRKMSTDSVQAERQEVIEQPRVLDLRDRVGLAPDPQNVVVVDL